MSQHADINPIAIPPPKGGIAGTPGTPELGRLRAGLPTARLRRATRRQPLAALAGLAFLCLVALAVAAPVLPLPDPAAQSLLDRLQGPGTVDRAGTRHLLGTDELGRDMLSRTIVGARASLGVAATTVLLSSVIGASIGLLAGYRGGWVDMVVMRVVDLQMAFPSLLMAIFVLYIVGASLVNLVVLLTILTWVGYARIVRAETLRAKALQHVEAARSIGCSNRQIVLRHILPLLAPLLIVVAVIEFGVVILAEAGLSYLGFGVQPPTPSWGGMVADGQQFVTTGAWWVFLVPGLAISGTVLLVRAASAWVEEFTKG